MTSIPIILLAFLIFCIPIGFVVHTIAGVFSAEIRSRIKMHPLIHILWFLVATVIIIYLLAPIIRSGPHHVNRSAQTRVYESCIVMASEAYYIEYGLLPLQTNAIDHNYHSEHMELYSILTGSSNAVTQNPRLLILLEPDVKFMSMKEERFIDAWGNQLNIIGDWDMDRVITVGTNMVTTSMAIWSNGKDGENNFGSGDDVNSWTR